MKIALVEKKTKPLEKDIQRKIVKFLKDNDFSVDVNTENMYTTAGRADIVACKCGLYIAIEVKRPGKKPTALQQSWLKEKEDHGAIVMVATSVEDVEKHLIKLLANVSEQVLHFHS